MSKHASSNEEEINALRKKLEPLYERYQEKRKTYEDAVSEYNNLRSNAMAGTDSNIIHEYTLNAHTYKEKVKGAMNDWVMVGHKNEVESMLSRIDQLALKSRDNPYG